MAALCITPVKKVMIKSEEKTPVKKTSPPKDVVSKTLMASVDLKEAIRRQSFFDHVKDGAPMKAKLAANKDGIAKNIQPPGRFRPTADDIWLAEVAADC